MFSFKYKEEAMNNLIDEKKVNHSKEVVQLKNMSWLESSEENNPQTRPNKG